MEGIKSDQKIARIQENLLRIITCFLKLTSNMGGQEHLWRKLHPTLAQQWMVMMDDPVSTEIVYGTFCCHDNVASEHGKKNQ